MKWTYSFRKLLPWIFSWGLLLLAASGGWVFLTASSLPRVDFLSDPEVSIQVNLPDWQGHHRPITVGPENPDWTPLKDIPLDLQNAVLAGEDFSFHYHNGIDWFELRESILKDLREWRFARGASTITQQVAKNLFLTREKSIKRKVKEVILARRLERSLSKDRILELYLNVVELGDRVYGVGAGARHHFDKKPSGLSLRESAFLAAMLPGPKVYDPQRNMERVMNRSDHLLGVMLKAGWIEEDRYLDALTEIPFAGEPADTDQPEQGTKYTEDMLPEINEEPLDRDEESPGKAPEDVGSEELLTTRDGIIEIPIK